MSADPIGDELDAIAAALTAAGIPATRDPATLWAMVSAEDVAALIDRPTELHPIMLGGHTLRLTVPVWLCARGPDADADTRLLPTLPAALLTLRPRDPATADRWSTENGSLPAYRIQSTRTVTIEG